MNQNIIYYDGNCALCHKAVIIILKLDTKNYFKFSPLFLLKINKKNLPDSLVLKLHNQLYYEGEAIIKIFSKLNKIGKILSLLLKFIPIKLLNIIYKYIAINRKRWKIKKGTTCPIIPLELKNRFILKK